MAKSAVYPRVYEYGPTTKALWCGFSLILILCGAACGACWLYDQDILQQTAITAAGIALAVFGLVCFQSSLRGKVVLYEEHLEYHGVLAVRRIRRDNIKETCEAGKQFGIFAITLVMKSGRPKRVQIYDFGKMDDAFEDFVNAYPNVEMKAQIAKEETTSAAINQNMALGNNENERLETYNRYERWVSWLGWPAIGLALWGIFYPKPYEICVYVLLSFPALCFLAVVVFRGRLSLSDDKTSGRVSLEGPATLPIWALSIIALNVSRSLIDWIVPAAMATAAAFALTGLIAITERRFNKGTAWTMVFMCGLYAWSAGVVLNDILDEAKPRIERVQVLGKQTKGSDPDYELHLASWGAFDQSDYGVSRKLYDKVEVGQVVCIRIYPGWLGWENYYVRSCDTGKPA